MFSSKYLIKICLKMCYSLKKILKNRQVSRTPLAPGGWRLRHPRRYLHLTTIKYSKLSQFWQLHKINS